MVAKATVNDLPYSTTFIHTLGNGKEASGTGFFYAHVEGDAHINFLVTNRHVVEGMTNGAVLLTRRKPDGSRLAGANDKIELLDFTQRWGFHPDPSIDIAVTPIEAKYSNTHHFARFTEAVIPTHEVAASFNVVEEILFIGYPRGLYDKANNLPIVRRGITATPIAQDYENTPTFLIDASVFPGSSGSPAVLYDTLRVTKSGEAFLREKIYFLGVVSRQFNETLQGKMVDAMSALGDKIPETMQSLDLGLVYKSSTVADTVKDWLNKHPHSQSPHGNS